MTGGVIKFGQVGEVVTTETGANADVDTSQSHTNNTMPQSPPTNEFPFGKVGEVVTTETDANANVDASQSHTNNTTSPYPPTNEVEFGQVGEVVTTETDANADVDASQSHTNNTTPPYPPTNEFDVFITPHKLNGNNYVQWSQSLLIHLAHRDKEGYINGDLPAPAQTESTYKAWKINDNLVKS